MNATGGVVYIGCKYERGGWGKEGFIMSHKVGKSVMLGTQFSLASTQPNLLDGDDGCMYGAAAGSVSRAWLPCVLRLVFQRS
jgi:hypothetical protein